MSRPPPPPPFTDESTRKIVLAVHEKLVKQSGAAMVFRVLGGFAVTAGLGIAAAGYGYAQQAAVDHSRVDRLELNDRDTREELVEIRRLVTEVRESTARIEGELEDR